MTYLVYIGEGRSLDLNGSLINQKDGSLINKKDGSLRISISCTSSKGHTSVLYVLDLPSLPRDLLSPYHRLVPTRKTHNMNTSEQNYTNCVTVLLKIVILFTTKKVK